MPSPTEAPRNSHSSCDRANTANNNPNDGSPTSMRPPTAPHRSPVSSSPHPSMSSLASSLPRTQPTRLDVHAEGSGASQVTRSTTNAAQASPSPLSRQFSQIADGVSPSTGDGPRSELRYANMLSLLDRKDASRQSQGQSIKLIAGTNPLSALLGKDLKHKIVTNSCSFRTPDPTNAARQPAFMRGLGIHSCDWEQSYRSMDLPEPRLQYLKAMECFQPGTMR